MNVFKKRLFVEILHGNTQIHIYYSYPFNNLKITTSVNIYLYINLCWIICQKCYMWRCVNKHCGRPEKHTFSVNHIKLLFCGCYLSRTTAIARRPTNIIIYTISVNYIYICIIHVAADFGDSGGVVVVRFFYDLERHVDDDNYSNSLAKDLVQRKHNYTFAIFDATRCTYPKTRGWIKLNRYLI